jgi:JmjC domain
MSGTTDRSTTHPTVARVREPAWRTVHFPDPADPAEAPLARANQLGRVADAAWLTSQLGLPFASLVQTTDATTLSHTRSVAGLIPSIDPERELVELLTWRGVAPGQAKVVRDGTFADAGGYLEPAGTSPTARSRARVGQVASLLDDGWSLVFDGIELRNPVTGRLAEAFERIYGCTVNVNGYLSLRANTSFGTHWDDQEVVILQLIGAKDWEVRKPLALSMAKEAYGHVSSDEPVWKGRLEVGDALYIPRGWGHHVTGFDRLTYHHTITVPRLNGLHVTAAIMSTLAGPSGLDAVPGVDLGRGMAIALTPEDLDDRPADGLDPTAVDVLVRRVQAGRRLSIAPRSYQRLSVLLDVLEGGSTDVVVRCPCPGGWVVDRTDGEQVVAGMGGRQVVIRRDGLDVVAALTDGVPHPMPESGRAVDIARDLLRVGLLDATPR